ncbi:MAG TPA: BREX-2 system phosphatase PglZ, partial [Planctomycetaceae bacterium]|nr:BREX-2 system phosphatase PglZ [Planctomycetaceae bacterium]
MAAPSLAQIKAQIAAIRQKLPQARVIGIQSTGRWTGETFSRDGEHGYSIHQCDSPLSFRLALRKQTDDQTMKVLITSLAEQELGDDILLRLAKRRLFQIDPWQIVRSLFEAHAIDSRLTRHGWIAESLLELIPAAGYPAARGGFLDAETVWPLLLRMAVGLDSEAPDLQSLLKWSLNPDAAGRFQRLPEAFRQAAVSWLVDRAGPVAEILLHLVGQPDRLDAVPLGLVVGILYHPAAIGKLEKATGKLETRFPGHTSPDPELMLRWSAAAAEVVRGLRLSDPKLYRQTVQRADEILEEIQASPMAHLSDISPLGFVQRLARIGEALSDILARGAWDRLESLTDMRQRVGQHDYASQETRRTERVDMALRLVRWLGVQTRGDTSSPQSLADAARWHLREGGFVDWARLSLRSGDPEATLSAAYAQLFAQVLVIRERQSRVFAELLRDWTAAGSKGAEILAVEDILGAIVAPLAEKTQVLL